MKLTSWCIPGKETKTTPVSAIIKATSCSFCNFVLFLFACNNKIIIGPVAESTAANPEEIYCSAQYNVANVINVKQNPAYMIRFENTYGIISLRFNLNIIIRITPAKKKRIPAENNGGAPASIPIFIVKNVVPNIIHTKI